MVAGDHADEWLRGDAGETAQLLRQTIETDVQTLAQADAFDERFDLPQVDGGAPNPRRGLDPAAGTQFPKGRLGRTNALPRPIGARGGRVTPWRAEPRRLPGSRPEFAPKDERPESDQPNDPEKWGNRELLRVEDPTRHPRNISPVGKRQSLIDISRQRGREVPESIPAVRQDAAARVAVAPTEPPVRKHQAQPRQDGAQLDHIPLVTRPSRT